MGFQIVRQGGWRVVVASRIFVPEVAAASFRLHAVARALTRRGARVRVLTSHPVGTALREETDTGQVRRVWTLRDSTGYLRGYLPYASFDIPLFFRLLVTRADVVLVEPPPTTGVVVRLVCAVKRVPYVYYAADLWSDAVAAAGMKSVVARILRHVEGFALRGASAVIAVNRGVADRARDLGAACVHVVPNGIDTSVFTPSGGLQHATRDKTPCTGVDEDLDQVLARPFVVYAGTASEWQGAGIFYDAFDKIRDQVDVDLVWIGQGADMEHIAQRAQHDSRVHVLGVVDAPQAATIQALAQVALVSIVPGRGYDFAYPTKVLAALACGTPVLFAGKGPAASDIEQHHLGRVSDYETRHIAEVLTDMLTQDWQAQRLRQWVSEHRSMTATGQKAAEVVLNAIGENRAQ